MDTHKKKMLITGVSGLLGNNLAVYFRNRFDVLGLYLRHPVHIDGVRTTSCDIADKQDIVDFIVDFSPDIVIHCASMTNIEKCEVEKEKTKRVNVDGTENIVCSLKNKDTFFVYISTDAVYRGEEKGNKENDWIEPQNYYGATKYDGEKIVSKWKNSLILRTNIFGWNIQEKQSIAEWVLNALKGQSKIQGFADAYFSSIYTFEFAKIIDQAITAEITGTYNCGSRDSCSKYVFACKIAAWFDLKRDLISEISIDEFAFNARRGKYLALDSSRLEKALDYRFPSIDSSIEHFYRDYKCGLPDRIKSENDYGPPGKKIIPYGRQSIDARDVQKVTEVLLSDWITQGPTVDQFERRLSKSCNAEYAVAVNSGTAALHIACLAADIGEGDEVITTPITFVASANCAAYCGASPVFADIDPKTYNISATEIARKINARTKAVIPVHFAGQSCDMRSIQKVVNDAEKKFGHKIYIIEDGSHALGSEYRDARVGSCAYSDMTTLSFHPVKHITTGEGGAVLTADPHLRNRLKRFRSHGITSDPREFTKINEKGHDVDNPGHQVNNPWYYEQIDLGYNYRITDIQCALGVSQLEKLEVFRKRRRYIVNTYNAAFDGIENITIPHESENCSSNFHLYVLLFDFPNIGISRSHFMVNLKKANIQTQVHYIPVHTQPYYQKHFNTALGDLPNAEAYYEKCLSIPLHPSLTDADLEYVMTKIKKMAA